MDVQVLDEHHHGGSGLGSAYPGVVHFAVVSQRDSAVSAVSVVSADDVSPDPVVLASADGVAFGHAW